MEETDNVIFIVKGEKYERLKKSFKKLRDKHKLSHARGNPETSTWIKHDEALTAFYMKNNDILIEARLSWSSASGCITPLLSDMLKLFIGGK